MRTVFDRICTSHDWSAGETSAACLHDSDPSMAPKKSTPKQQSTSFDGSAHDWSCAIHVQSALQDSLARSLQDESDMPFESATGLTMNGMWGNPAKHRRAQALATRAQLNRNRTTRSLTTDESNQMQGDSATTRRALVPTIEQSAAHTDMCCCFAPRSRGSQLMSCSHLT